MEGEVTDEVQALVDEYNWMLNDEVHHVLHEVNGILAEACRRFPVPLQVGGDNLVKPEKFVFSNPNGGQQVKCMITLMADTICEAELTLRVHKQQPAPVILKIYPDAPWRVQQIQDAGNHLTRAMSHAESKDITYHFQSGREVISILDAVIECLNRGRTCLALPKKKSLEEISKNPSLKIFNPSLPSDVVLSFYVQAQKLILAVYQLYCNHSQKIDIHSKYQVECSVPWLNDILVLFTLALQQCQQLRDKVLVFQPYEEQEEFLRKLPLDNDQTNPCDSSHSLVTFTAGPES